MIIIDIQVISPVIQRLHENNINYSLGGSGMLYYLNLVDEVNDWDIVVACSKEKIIDILSPFEWNEESSGDYPFASQYRISLPFFNIEFIGGFALHSEAGIFRLPVKSIGKWNDISISCPEVWYVAYSLMKRDRKAKLIYQYLMNNVDKRNDEVMTELINNKEINKELRNTLLKLIQ